jgi:hypothetical protein
MKKETLKELAAITPSLRTKKPTYLQEIAKKSDPPSKKERDHLQGWIENKYSHCLQPI